MIRKGADCFGLCFLIICQLLIAPAKLRGSTTRPGTSHLEPNRGQAPEWAEYVFSGRSYGALIDGDTLVVRAKDANRRMTEVWLQFEGTLPTLQAEPAEILESRTNYLLGSDPSRWITDIPQYRRVRYKKLYPAVDLLYDGSGEALEYQLRLFPGADPNRICLRIDSHYRVHLDNRGALIVGTGDISFVLAPPAAFQQGQHGLRHVEVAYKLHGNEVRFQLGRSIALTIDPYIVYATNLGGYDPLVSIDAPGVETATDVKADGAGNAYVVGNAAPNFPVTANAFQTTSTNTETAFVAKIDPQGSSLIYSTFISGMLNPHVAIDGDGNVYCAGSAQPGLAVTSGAFQTNPRSLAVIKLSATGNALMYATYVGGSGFDQVNGVALDASRNLLIAGSAASNDFPVKGAVQGILAGGTDGFLTKLKSNGSMIVYSTYLGGSSNDEIDGVAVDSSGDAIVTGSTRSANFPTADALQPSCNGPSSGSCSINAFLAMLDPAGTRLVYSTFFGGSGSESVAGVAVDNAGEPVIVGTTSSTDLPLLNPLQSSLASGAQQSGFVTKFNAGASAPLFSTYFNGMSPSGVAVDTSGDVLFTGAVAGNPALVNALIPIRGRYS